MRSRIIKKQFYINEDENLLLKNKANKIGFNEAELIRNLIAGYEPKEKPKEGFYEYIKIIRSISNNINQISKVANSNGFINIQEYEKEINKLDEFIILLKEQFLKPTQV